MPSIFSADWRNEVNAELAAKQALNATLTQLANSGTLNLFGGQIGFPAAQVPSADPNTLDDYEEGAWTPAIAGTTTAGVGTYTTQTGAYTKIGNVFTFLAQVSWSAHTGTGNMILTGMPFVASGNAPCSIDYSGLTFPQPVTATVNTATTNILLRSTASTAGATGLGMDTAATILVAGIART
jgi:hypothetical protein